MTTVDKYQVIETNSVLVLYLMVRVVDYLIGHLNVGKVPQNYFAETS